MFAEPEFWVAVGFAIFVGILIYVGVPKMMTKALDDRGKRVQAELDEAARQRARPRIIPLRVKWAATMALVVMVVMGLSASLITRRQHAAMLEQVTGYGASLARFMAAQNAVPALAEDWPGVDVAVQEMMKTGDFHSITVIDRDNIVRAAGEAARVGQPYARPGGEPLASPDARVTLARYTVGKEPILGFETSINYFHRRPKQDFCFVEKLCSVVRIP